MDDDKTRLDRIADWARVRDAFARAGELFEEASNLAGQRSVEGSGAAVADAPPRGGGRRDGRTGASGGPPPVYVERRQALREALVERLRPALEDRVGPRQTYHAMVALSSYIDERERTALGDLAREWNLPFLQTELAQIDDGGDRFFDAIDELLARPDTFALVYELYFLCLRSGFVGKCKGKPEHADDYRKRLEQAIERDRGSTPGAPGGESAAATGPLLPHKVTFVGFPYRDYAAALGAALVLFVVLRLAAHHVVVASHVGASCDLNGSWAALSSHEPR